MSTARVEALSSWRGALEDLLGALNQPVGDDAALETSWARCEEASREFQRLQSAADDMPDEVHAAMADVLRMIAVAQGLAVRSKEDLVGELSGIGEVRKRLRNASEPTGDGSSFDLEG